MHIAGQSSSVEAAPLRRGPSGGSRDGVKRAPQRSRFLYLHLRFAEVYQEFLRGFAQIAGPATGIWSFLRHSLKPHRYTSNVPLGLSPWYRAFHTPSCHSERSEESRSFPPHSNLLDRNPGRGKPLWSPLSPGTISSCTRRAAGVRSFGNRFVIMGQLRRHQEQPQGVAPIEPRGRHLATGRRRLGA
jgi:hypothetical protein